MVLKTYITKGVGIKMDQEIKDYLERKLTVLATKDDIEKIRQETNANFRKLKEENKTQATEWTQEIKGDLEQLTKSKGLEPDLIQETMKEGLMKIRVESQSAIDQLKQTIESSLQRFKETGEVQAFRSKEETKSAMDQFKEGVEKFQGQMKKIGEEMVSLNQEVREGLTGVKDELGSMIKFSYSDLEKKLTALEVRVKSLEKMVLP
jgi:actin-like ATPase involved in cell morphogenesis